MEQNADQSLWQLAARQSGYVTRGQALALGLTHSMLRTRLARGAWSKISPGVYVVAGHQPSVPGLLAGACASLGAVVSHESAAELHDLPLIERGRAVVTVAVRRTHEFAGVVVHQSTDLTDADLTEVDRLPTTTIVRTIVDLAAVIRPNRLERLIDRSLAARRCSLDDLAAIVGRLARRGKPGISALRAALEVRLPGYTPTESELEFQLAALLRGWGFPDPVRQLGLPWRSSREGRVDFAYPDLRLIIEADGRAWHSTVEAFDSDRSRDNLAQLAGWRVLRITWPMMQDRPAETRALIAEAFRVLRTA